MMRQIYWRLQSREWLLKLKMLWLYRGGFRDWYREVWRQEPYDQMCCSGYMCGCMGSCYADMWEHCWKTAMKSAIQHVLDMDEDYGGIGFDRTRDLLSKALGKGSE